MFLLLKIAQVPLYAEFRRKNSILEALNLNKLSFQAQFKINCEIYKCTHDIEFAHNGSKMFRFNRKLFCEREQFRKGHFCLAICI